MYMHGMIVGPCVRSMWSLRALYTRTAQYYVERIIGTRTWDFLLGFIQRRPTYVHCTALHYTALLCLACSWRIAVRALIALLLV
ncbi:hypothetical protein VFPBJ_05783 [Purpureocillium lilacinum]|uniref:Uncharacterized protein n=1 Tax=Purpureocillium lilacinum TaxID=33203 RepID=A0A179GRR0_PURLI|nr:hypothetical protein VFPBJ_05783 [Purpureocillium lilacinum]